MVKDIDREQHSLLRSDWREYLKEGIGTSEKERKLRQRIRDRILTGLYDIALINQYARDEDIKQVFDRLAKDQTENPEQSELVNGDKRDMAETHFVAARGLVALAWRGLRECGVDKQRIFEKVIVRAIEDGEADYKNVPHGHVDSDIQFRDLEAIQKMNELDPLEKWERGLARTGEDIQELINQLPEGTVVGEGEDIGELINKHLVESDE